MQQKKRLDIHKPKTIEEKERMRLTIKALKFGLISEEQAIKLGYKPKKLKSLPKLQKRKKRANTRWINRIKRNKKRYSFCYQ